MYSKLLALLMMITFFCALMTSVNAKGCPDPAPFCEDTEVCIFNQNTQTCTCSCCDDNGLNCKQNFP
ncbi:13339_t:CDS:2 [Funneliformis geosporum]|uniref:13339_t:CDS:1 n=1 Tax=Funneliformis geosporum TaxID=1117311 RepID=A0A9W4SN38_9GLOM|nr:13339_t:CDS:2 [Funneliformis geosporum]